MRKVIASPSANHGLVLGSVTESRPATFEIDTDGFGASVVGRLTILQ